MSFDFFSKNLVQICNDHLRNGRASAFAFIIYDFQNPHIAEILENKNYWNSLDLLSGNWLSIFTVFDSPLEKEIQKHWKRSNPKTKHSRKNKTSERNSETDSIIFSMNSEKSYRTILNNDFASKKIDFKSPHILFFQVNELGVSDFDLVALKENKVEDGFLELQELIKTSVDTVKYIFNEDTIAKHGDNRTNHDAIYREIKSNIDRLNTWKLIGRHQPLLRKVVDFLSNVSGYK